MLEIYQEPKKSAELQPGVRNFCGDFNARLKVVSTETSIEFVIIDFNDVDQHGRTLWHHVSY